MKWKVTVQFLVALMIIGIAINFINAAVMSYYYMKATRANDPANAASVLMLKTALPFDFTSFNTQVTMLNGKLEVMPGAVDDLVKAKGWVQFIDGNGNVLKSINTPEDVSMNLPANAGNPEDAPVRNGKYSIFIRSIQYNDGRQIKYMMGFPKQLAITSPILMSFVSYFLIWNEPKIVSIVLTILTVLLLGYIFGRMLTQPVVKVIDGISGLEKGNYHRDFPEKGIYKDVFKSLNNLAEALKASEMERKKIEKMREEWMANITHDLKTPLSSIKGYAELLSEPEYRLVSVEGKNYAEIILNKSNYLETLLEDLKLTQKLKNDLLPLKKEAGNLVETLREVVIGLLNDPKFSDRKVVFTTEQEDIPLNYDPILMQRALCNIVFNAVVHNPEETEVHVTIYKKERIHIKIEDNGKGIPEDELQNLFERYYRGTNTEETYNGSGLGLAIAKQIIEAHGGSISLESEIDKGTKVMIRF